MSGHGSQQGCSGSWRSKLAPRAVLVSLLFSLLLLAGCRLSIGPLSIGGAAAPALPQGWTWYHDSQFPFDAPVPPGWQAHGYWNWTDANNKQCQRKVDLVPPMTQPAYARNPYDVRPFPELVTIVVANTCSDFVPSVDIPWLKSAGQTQVGSATGALYTQDDQAAFQHVVIARFGGHQYVFTYYHAVGTEAPLAHSPADLALFNTTLKDFVYHGK